MKEFKVKNGPFIKSNNDTRKMMYHVIICLIPIILFSIYKNGFLPIIKGYGSILDILKIIILLLASVITNIVVEYIFFIIKKDKKNILYLIEKSFAIIPGIFIALIIPINTPIWLVIIASMIASLSKMLFGGLGKNIMNPAITGSIIIIILACSYISKLGGYLNSYEIATLNGITPLANFKVLSYAASYQELVGAYGSIWSFFFGNVPGAIGTTNILLCIIAFVYLVINKVIKWRIPIYCIGTIFVMSTIIGLSNGMGLWYSVFNILIGSVLFGSIFMATDPVTSPITKHSQILGGIILGIITIGIRYLTSLYEGELIAILIFNFITIFLNKMSIQYNFNKMYKLVSIIIVVVIGIILSIIISNNIEYQPSNETNYQIANIK